MIVIVVIIISLIAIILIMTTTTTTTTVTTTTATTTIKIVTSYGAIESKTSKHVNKKMEVKKMPKARKAPLFLFDRAFIIGRKKTTVAR